MSIVSVVGIGSSRSLKATGESCGRFSTAFTRPGVDGRVDTGFDICSCSKDRAKSRTESLSSSVLVESVENVLLSMFVNSASLISIPRKFSGAFVFRLRARKQASASLTRETANSPLLSKKKSRRTDRI